MPQPRNNDAWILARWQEGWTVEKIATALGSLSQLPHVVSVLEKNSIPWQRRSKVIYVDERGARSKNLDEFIAGVHRRGRINLSEAKHIQRELAAEEEIRRIEGMQD